MKEIAERLHEQRQIELAKEILESNGYTVTKIVSESHGYKVEEPLSEAPAKYGILDKSKYNDSNVDKTNMKNLYTITYIDTKHPNVTRERNANKFIKSESVWGLENAKRAKKEIESKGYNIKSIFNGIGKNVEI